MKNRLSREFDDISKSYWRFHRARCYDERVLNELCDIPKSVLCVEIGCGDGAFLKKLHDYGYEYLVGTDASGQMLKLAGQRNIPQLSLLKADPTLPFMELSSQSADCVIAKFVLHDYVEIKPALTAIWNTLRPGGRVIILDRYWESSRTGHLLAFIKMEYWLLITLTRKHGFARGGLMFFQDLSEWFSHSWRLHRRSEPKRTLLEWDALFEAFDATGTTAVINSSSFLRTLHKNL